MDTKTAVRIAKDVAAGRAPDDAYTPHMKVLWKRFKAELDAARKTNPKAFLSIPNDIDGLPD
jgi:hypothetical protein